MADYGPVKLREKEIKALIDLYKKTALNINKEILGATEARQLDLIRTMVKINRELESLGVDAEAWFKRELPQYYNDGGNIALQDLRKLGVELEARGATVLNRDAIEALVVDATASYSSGVQGLSRSARSILSNALRQRTTLAIAEGRLTNETRRAISARVEQILSEGGLKAITDRAGKEWTLDNYSEMLVRTKAVEARNQGLTNKMVQYGYDLVQISNHNSKHAACRRWEGKILSITGNTPGYPTLDEAKSAGLFHPRCQHAMNVIDVELAKQTKAYDNPYNRR